MNPAGEGNLDGTQPANNPLFVQPEPASAAPTAAGYYRPQYGSPALNAGKNSLNTQPTDIEGSPRIQEGTIEIGAYEVNYNFDCMCD